MVRESPLRCLSQALKGSHKFGKRRNGAKFWAKAQRCESLVYLENGPEYWEQGKQVERN